MSVTPAPFACDHFLAYHRGFVFLRTTAKLSLAGREDFIAIKRPMAQQFLDCWDSITVLKDMSAK